MHNISIPGNDKRCFRPTYDANRGAQALGIVQSEIVRTGYRIRNARLSGLREMEIAHKRVLFTLLDVRRAMRSAKIDRA